MDISFVITPWNCKDLLKATIDSVKKSKTKFTYEVIVYDHGSTDGSLEMLENEYPDVKLIKGGDVGFAAANNEGLKISTGRYVVLLNADTEVSEDTIETMINFMDSRPDIGVATGKLVLAVSGKLDPACRRGFPTPWVSFARFSGLAKLFPKSALFNRYNMSYLSEDDEYEIDSCSGAFQMSRREVVDKIGYLDDTFYMYGEDIDWCYRAKEAGWKVYYYPKTVILHYKGYLSGKSKTKKRHNPRPTWEFHRAMVLFYDKHYKNKYPRIFRLFIKLAIWLRYLLIARFQLHPDANFNGNPNPYDK
jgi:GT2 family glycosyltransferase